MYMVHLVVRKIILQISNVCQMLQQQKINFDLAFGTKITKIHDLASKNIMILIFFSKALKKMKKKIISPIILIQ